MYDLSRTFPDPSPLVHPFPTLTLSPGRKKDHSQPLPAIIHFSAQNPYTKYEMTRLIAHYLDLPIGHVIPDTTDPATLPDQAVLRPGNTQLSVDALEDMGIRAEEEKGFEQWWREWAGRYRARKA